MHLPFASSRLPFARLTRPRRTLAAAVLLAATAATLTPLSLRAQRLELTDTSAQPVVVETAAIRTEVTGRLAVTTFDLVFRNPNNRILEGTFSFPLLDAQNVIRFALDVNGALREAVPVEKTKGRIVFEDIERRRIDPGLLEQTAGNNYRARVYPIPARGTRRIVIAYQEDLTRGAAPVYRLALDFPDRLQQFSVHLAVHTGSSTPAKLHSTLPFALPAWRDARLLDLTERDVIAKGILELDLPPTAHPRVITGRHRADDNEYFYAEVPVSLPPVARPAPRTLGLLWDSSGSGQARDHAREFALLDALFAQFVNVDIHLVELRDRASPSQRFTVARGNWSALKTALKNLAYDGATSLEGLDQLPAADEWLLFSDGLFNYGHPALSAPLDLERAPLHAILASPSADTPLLRALAARHAGEFVNLLEIPAAPAAARLRTHSARVLDVTYPAGALAEVFPEPGASVVGDTVLVTGRLRAAATLELKIGHTPADARTVTLDLRPNENPSPLAPRGWATAKVNHLSLDPLANREDLRRTAQDFGIVTADTSLIVLETVADYVRYDIAPPAELEKEWSAQRSRNLALRQKGRDHHLEQIVRMFEQRLAWWEDTFPKDTPPREWKGPRISSYSPALPARPAPAEGTGTIVLQAFNVARDREGPAAANTIVGGAPARATFGSAAPARQVGGAFADVPVAADAITLKPWKPNAPYLDRLRRAKPERAYAVYLEERLERRRQPGFFLDVASFFFERETPNLAFRVLSNLAELELEDVALLRVLAHRLTQADRPDLALPLFERVLALRPDEPQSRRDLVLAHLDLKNHQRAIDLLWDVVTQTADARFHGIQLTALTELNALAATCGDTLDLSRIDPRLRRNLPVGARVVLTWDANDCDIDLWVTDPNHERAAYNFPLTYQGGLMSRDFTAGYGPEEFVLRDPKPGRYRVHIDYYGDARQTAIGPVTAQLRFITGFGSSAQSEKRLTVRLDDKKQNREVGTFDIAPDRLTKR